MKITQAIKLGHRSLAGHKRRNLTTIIIVGVMFGFMMGVIFLTQGVQNVVRRAADEALGDNYYIAIQTDFWNEKRCRNELIPEESDDDHSTYRIICEKHDLAQLKQNVQNLGGEIIALSESYALPLSPEAAAPFMQESLDVVPNTAVPVLESTSMILYNLFGDRSYNMNYIEVAKYIRDGTIASALGEVQEPTYSAGTTMVPVGILPSGTIRQLNTSNTGASLNPLDYILDFVGMNSNMGGGEVVINNDSAATRAYLGSLNERDPIAENSMSAVLRFNSFGDAEEFADRYTCPLSERSMGCKKEFFLESRFDNRIPLARTGAMVWWGLGIAEIVLLAFAVVITLLTLSKVLHGESKTIALYRSLGASTSDVAMIYLAYTLEVCLLAVGFALLMGMIMALVISFSNTSNMMEMLTVAYYKAVDWPIMLVGWNPDILKIILVMLAVAPVSLVCCLNVLKKR